MRKVIAGIEVVSGLLVLILFFVGIGMKFGLEASQGSSTQFTQWSLKVVLQAIIPLIWASINIIAGVNLWKNKNSGYKLSMVTQFIQLFSIQTPNFYAYFYSLLGVIFAFSQIGMQTIYGFGVAYQISFSLQPVPATFIGVNIVALILLIIISFLFRKKIKSRL